jgi:SHS2 domain-containing protein
MTRADGTGGPERGHHIVEHTADEILEAWGPTRAACLEEAATGLVGLFAQPRAGAATRTCEFTLDASEGTALLLALLDEIIYLLDAHDRVPAATRIADLGHQVRVRLELVTVNAVEPTGPTPKGVSRSQAHLRLEDGRWTSRALIDV